MFLVTSDDLLEKSTGNFMILYLEYPILPNKHVEFLFDMLPSDKTTLKIQVFKGELCYSQEK